MKRVVITGIGIIASPGIGKELFWDGLKRLNLGLERVQKFLGDEIWEEYFLYKINNFRISNFFSNKSQLKYIEEWKEGEHNPDLLLFIAAIKLSLMDARLDVNNKEVTEQISLIVSHENPGLEQFIARLFEEAFLISKKSPEIQRIDFYRELYKNSVKLAYETQSFMFLFHLAKIFNINNQSLVINNACASGLYAIDLAKDAILAGKAKKVVVVAGDCPDIYKHLWFKKLNMYSYEGKIKAFDRDSKGFILGEGAVAFLLEDYECALVRNAKIYAEYIGGDFQLDNWSVLYPNVESNFLALSIKNALKKTKIVPKQIDLICAHGAATKLSDVYEAKSIKKIFKDNAPVTTFKSYVGHNLGGSSLLELAILMLCLDHKIILPVLNTTDILDELRSSLVKKVIHVDLKIVMKICTAFAGFNASLIFKRID